jgi:hypothetical protein
MKLWQALVPSTTVAVDHMMHHAWLCICNWSMPSPDGYSESSKTNHIRYIVVHRVQKSSYTLMIRKPAGASCSSNVSNYVSASATSRITYQKYVLLIVSINVLVLPSLTTVKTSDVRSSAMHAGYRSANLQACMHPPTRNLSQVTMRRVHALRDRDSYCNMLLHSSSSSSSSSSNSSI